MKKAATVDAYLDQVPEPARTTLQKLRAAIRAAAPPEAVEKIAYGMPSFYYKGPLAYYAAFQNHCSYFPADGELVARFAADLKNYEVAKGTIRFSPAKPLPAALVKKIIRAKAARNEAKLAAKKR